VSRLKRSDSGLRLRPWVGSSVESEECGSDVRGQSAWATCTSSHWQRGVKRGQTPSAVNHQLWFMSSHTQTISSALPLDSSKGNRALLCLYMLELEEAAMPNRRWSSVVLGDQTLSLNFSCLLMYEFWSFPVQSLFIFDLFLVGALINGLLTGRWWRLGKTSVGIFLFFFSFSSPSVDGGGLKSLYKAVIWNQTCGQYQHLPYAEVFRSY